MIPAELWLFKEFLIKEGLSVQGIPEGWIIGDQTNGNWVWTGGVITAAEAMSRLYKARRAGNLQET